jgi:hypothetical protein
MCNIIACTLDKEEFVGIVQFPIPRLIDQKRQEKTTRGVYTASTSSR